MKTHLVSREVNDLITYKKKEKNTAKKVVYQEIIVLISWGRGLNCMSYKRIVGLGKQG